MPYLTLKAEVCTFILDKLSLFFIVSFKKSVIIKLVNMAKKFNIIIEKDEEGWFVSEVVGLPGCHTQAKNMDQLIERTKEAIKAYLQDDNSSQESSDEFIGMQQIEVEV